MSEWQPIETAPKDGSWFLAFYPKIDPWCFQDQWKVAHWVADWFHEGYPGIMDAAEHEEFDQPTHWMPLTQPALSPDEERSDTGSPQERGQPDTEDLSKVMI